MWECGNEICCEVLRICALGCVVEVRYAGWLLVTSLGDEVLTRMPCHARWLCP